MQKYRAGTFTVSYDPKVCTHAARCVRDLPAVFDVNKQPWVNVNGAPEDDVARQVAACPSGALRFEHVTVQSE